MLFPKSKKVNKLIVENESADIGQDHEHNDNFRRTQVIDDALVKLFNEKLQNAPIKVVPWFMGRLSVPSLSPNCSFLQSMAAHARV